jgi:glycosyltransferase involved in cell wall biosynthesis
MQLDATLRSLAETCLEAAELVPSVLFAATTEIDRRQYGELAASHPKARFIEEANFGTDLLALLADRRFVLFLVDDALFTAEWSLTRIRNALVSDNRLIGVSLRLGTNISWCYTLAQPQLMPPTSPLDGDLVAFDYSGGTADFGYPLEVSSSLFRTNDIRPIIEAAEFRNPNQLEMVLDRGRASLREQRPLLASFLRSVAFTNPVNVVQTEFPNRYAQEVEWSAPMLRRLFDSGVRIDLAPYRGYVTTACHEERPLQFQYPEPGEVSAKIELTIHKTGGSRSKPLVSFSSSCNWVMPERPSSVDFDVLYALSVLGRVSKNRGVNWLTSFAELMSELWHPVERELNSLQRSDAVRLNEAAAREKESAAWRAHLNETIAEQNVELGNFRNYRAHLTETIAEQNVELDKFRNYMHEIRTYNHELRRVIEVGANEISERRVAMEKLQRDLAAATAVQETLRGKLDSTHAHAAAELNATEMRSKPVVDEAWYLQTYPDVAQAIREGRETSAYDHFVKFGNREGRMSAPLANAAESAGALFRVEDIVPDTMAPAWQSTQHEGAEPDGAESAAEDRTAPLVSVLQLGGDRPSETRWHEQTLSSVELLGTATAASEVASRLTAAHGKYLLVLTGTEKLEPTALERMVAALVADPSVPLIVAHQSDEDFTSEEPSIAGSPSCLSWAVMLRATALPQLSIADIAAGPAAATQPYFSRPPMPHIFTNLDLSANTSPGAANDTIEDANARVVPEISSALAALVSRQFLRQNSERKPILIILPWLPVGGAESLLHRVISGLAAEYEFIIVTTLPDPHAWHERFLRLAPYIYHLPDFLPPHLWKDFLLLKIAQLRISRVVVSGSQYGYSFLPHAKAAIPDLQTYSLLHNDEWEGHRANALRVKQSIDHFIAISKRIATTLRYLDRIELDRIHTICNGVDTEGCFSPSLVSRSAARRRFGLPLDRQVIAFVGRLSWEKDPEAFLEVINRCPQREDVEFAIFGKGPLDQQVRDRISALGKAASIHWVPYVAPELMPELFASIDLLVITSKSEGLPLVLLEAMAMEVPAVAYDVGDIASVIENGASGFIVPAGDLNALADQVQRLIAGPQDRIAMGNAARRRLIQVGLTERQMLATYRAVLSGEKAARTTEKFAEA